jgi:large subunit ribosomal protein L9
MKIILQREVDKLGVPGDVVEVADGYARNYLLPKGMATPATRGAVRHADSLQRAHRQRVEKAKVEAEGLAERLQAVRLLVTHQVGEEGRLFGSITSPDLAEEIEKAAGISVDRRDIHLDEPIRSVGSHEFRVHLHADVNATLTVEVVPTAS